MLALSVGCLWNLSQCFNRRISEGRDEVICRLMTVFQTSSSIIPRSRRLPGHAGVLMGSLRASVRLRRALTSLSTRPEYE